MLDFQPTLFEVMRFVPPYVKPLRVISHVAQLVQHRPGLGDRGLLAQPIPGVLQDSPDNCLTQSKTGLATLRRDGFSSLVAREAGAVTTRPIRFKGRYLFVNADVDHGELRAEILGADGKVIEPFSRSNCIPHQLDSTNAQIQWRPRDDLKELAGQAVQFRFYLTKGSIYWVWVSPDRSGASYGYVAAGGPGFSGPTDTVGDKGSGDGGRANLSDLDKLQGTWRLVSHRRCGTSSTPQTMSQRDVMHYKLVVSGDKYVFYHRRMPVEEVIVIDESEEPKTMDFRFLDRFERKGIYRFEGDRLTICRVPIFGNFRGDLDFRPTKFEIGASSLEDLVLQVWQRAEDGSESGSQKGIGRVPKIKR